MKRIPITVIALALVGAACAGATGGTSDEATSETNATVAPTTATPASSAPGTATVDRGDAEAYLVSVANVLAEARNLRESCEEDALPEDPTEEPDFPTLIRTVLIGCMLDPHADTTERLEALVVPDAFADVHAGHLTARHAWLTAIRPLAEALQTMDDFVAAMEDPAFRAATEAYTEACRDLRSAAAGAGFDVELFCDAPLQAPPDPDMPEEAAVAEIGDLGWSVGPAGVLVQEPVVLLRIRNVGSSVRRPVVVQLFSGEPDRLPLVGDIVDLAQSGVIMEPPDPDRAYFGLSHPEPTGEGPALIVPELGPGEELEVTLLTGEYVMFDHTAGTYAGGEYGVLVVASIEEIEAAHVIPTNAAQTCDQLAEAIASGQRAYMEQVRVLPVEDFNESPLAMIDDLRFGSAIARMAALGCDDAALEQAVRDRVCAEPPPDAPASREIYDRVCDA